MVSIRRVQLTGLSTLTVSLPKSWVKRNNVQPGQELFLNEEQDGSVSVRLSHSPTSKQVTIDVDKFTSANELRRAFLSHYVAGDSVFNFNAETKIPSEMRKVIADETHRLMGIEIVNESPRNILVQDFFSQEGLSVEKSIKRSCLITNRMFEDVATAVKTSSQKMLSEVIFRDDEVDRLHFLLLRQLNLALRDSSLLRELGLTSVECVYFAILVKNIERSADRVSKIAEYLSEAYKETKKMDPSMLEPLSKSRELFSESVDSFLTNDVSKANDLLNKIHIASKRVRDLKKRKSGSEINYLLVLDNVASILDHCAEISALTNNRSALSQ
ncbi:MAG: phosphate uptake regulator PhoU [Candidatus Micrarchaeota archaeon]